MTECEAGEKLEVGSDRYFDPEPIPEEEFRDIDGFEGKYQVSNLGRVKSLCYYGHEGNEGILSPRWTTTDSNNGEYATVRLIDGGEEKDVQKRISRLVASAFIPNPEEKSEVNHISGNTKDDRVTNLEWVTRSENQKHAIEEGLANMPENPNPKGSGKKYAWENKDGRTFFGTPAELIREYPNDEIDETAIYKIADDSYQHHKSLKGWSVIETPPPGSDKAIDMGGSCPVLENNHGRGNHLGSYTLDLECPLHGDADG